MKTGRKESIFAYLAFITCYERKKIKYYAQSQQKKRKDNVAWHLK